jgi:hypothetical protein
LEAPSSGLPVLSIPPASLPPEPPRQTALQVAAADAQPIDFMELSFAQPSCPDVQAMLASPSLSVVSKKVGAVEVLGDVSTGVFRPLLPARFRAAAVLSLHNIHHPGVRASRRLVCSSFCWPKMGVFRFHIGSKLSSLSKSESKSPRVAPGCPHSGPGSPFFAPTR